MINETKEKKAKILLRNVVYSSLYNERPKRAGDKCVFERMLLLQLFYGKATV